MTNCGHHKKICTACEKVIEQCRCMDQNKPITYTICDTCKNKAISPEVFVKRFIHACEGNRNTFLESDIRILYKEAKRIEGVIDGK